MGPNRGWGRALNFARVLEAPPPRVGNRHFPLRRMSSDKAKKMKAAAKEGDEQLNFDEPDAIDGQVILSIEKLQEIQDELDKVNEEASDKVLEVEQKYNEIRMPVYARRNDIIKTIPDFWLTAFLSHPVLGELLSKEDQMIFKHLESLEVEDFKDVKSGYSITLNFSSNPFFENEKLSKTYSFSDEGTTTITGTTIKWKEGMDVTNGSPQKKGNKRTLTEESFFSWFSGTQQKDISDAFYDEVAEIIKEDLWPNPLKYFNNDTDEESDGNEGDEEGNEDGGSDENNDDQEENGDEEDDG